MTSETLSTPSLETNSPTTSGKAIASMVLGLLSLVLWILTAIPAIILGVLALRDIAKSNDGLRGTGQAIAGIFFATLWTFTLLVAAVFLPASSIANNSAKEANSMANLKTIGVALHMYHATYGHLPLTLEAADSAAPPQSWRVKLLPFLEQIELAKNYNAKLAWDDPKNENATQKVLDLYRSPFQTGKPTPTTNYLGVVGDGFVMNGKSSVRIRDIMDGTSATIYAVEYVPSPVRWAEPKDLTLEEYAAYVADPDNQPTGNGFLVLFVDGTVHRLKPGLTKEQLRPLFSIAGGEKIDRDLFLD